MNHAYSISISESCDRLEM